jgi:anti-sigma factor RsiW
MSCKSVRSELVAFHFGLVEGEARRTIEDHLVACSACVAELIALKRAIEHGEQGPAPPRSARDRLRRAVARELAPPEPQRPWAWWERPLAFAFAGSAVLAGMIAVRALTAGPGAPPHALAALEETR